MKIIEKIQTFDGEVHDNKQDANRHLERLERSILTYITCEIAGMFKSAYAERDSYIGFQSEMARLATGNFLLDNLHKFEVLSQIQEDRKLTANKD